jgi:hypothetical protein
VYGGQFSIDAPGFDGTKVWPPGTYHFAAYSSGPDCHVPPNAPTHVADFNTVFGSFTVPCDQQPLVVPVDVTPCVVGSGWGLADCTRECDTCPSTDTHCACP